MDGATNVYTFYTKKKDLKISHFNGFWTVILHLPWMNSKLKSKDSLTIVTQISIAWSIIRFECWIAHEVILKAKSVDFKFPIEFILNFKVRPRSHGALIFLGSYRMKPTNSYKKRWKITKLHELYEMTYTKCNEVRNRNTPNAVTRLLLHQRCEVLEWVSLQSVRKLTEI